MALADLETLAAKDREAQVQASLAQKMLDWAAPILAHESEQIAGIAYQILKDGKALDPQLAVQLWAQLYAMERLEALLRKKIRDGEIAGRRTPVEF